MINEIKPVVELVDNPTTIKLATETMPETVASICTAADVTEAAAAKLADEMLEALGVSTKKHSLSILDHEIAHDPKAPLFMSADMHSLDLSPPVKTTLNEIELAKPTRIPKPPALATSEFLNLPRFDLSPGGVTQITFPKDFTPVDKAKSMLAAQHANMIQYDEAAFNAAAGPLRAVQDGSAPIWPIDRITRGMQQRALDGSIAFVNEQKGNSYTEYLRNTIGKYDQLSWLTRRFTVGEK